MINYTDGIKWEPTENGVYACRVPDELPGLYRDIFLIWIDDHWSYPRSSQTYRGEVAGFIGPLQRKMTSFSEKSN